MWSALRQTRMVLKGLEACAASSSIRANGMARFGSCCCLMLCWLPLLFAACFHVQAAAAAGKATPEGVLQQLVGLAPLDSVPSFIAMRFAASSCARDRCVPHTVRQQVLRELRATPLHQVGNGAAGLLWLHVVAGCVVFVLVGALCKCRGSVEELLTIEMLAAAGHRFCGLCACRRGTDRRTRFECGCFMQQRACTVHWDRLLLCI